MPNNILIVGLFLKYLWIVLFITVGENGKKEKKEKKI